MLRFGVRPLFTGALTRRVIPLLLVLTTLPLFGVLPVVVIVLVLVVDISKYMNYMAGDFTQDIIRAIKAKMKSSPKCPSGVVGGGTSLGGTIRAVAGGMRAACGKSGQPNCSSVANRTRSKTS